MLVVADDSDELQFQIWQALHTNKDNTRRVTSVRTTSFWTENGGVYQATIGLCEKSWEQNENNLQKLLGKRRAHR